MEQGDFSGKNEENEGYFQDMRSILGENLIFAICLKAMGEMMRTVGSLSIGEGAEMGEYMDSCEYSLSI